MHTVSH